MNKVLHAYKRSLITIAVIGAFSAPFFVFADHDVTHTIKQLQDQIQALQAQINTLQTSNTGGTVGAVVVQIPSSTVVQPIFDDDTSDDDIIQLNNLRIQSISSTRLPAVISASYDFGITCQKFETEGAGKGVEIPCPASPSFLYQIRVDSDTILLLRNRGRARLSDFGVGDRINVYGFRDRDTGSIDALIMRNLDKPTVKQFIQLNNVEVVSGPSATRPPATLVVTQKGVSPCWDFGAGQETKSSSVIPCPLGVRITEKSPTVSGPAPIETPPAYYPRQYVIEVTPKTQILDLDRRSLALDKIQIGDTLNIYGSYAGDSSQILALTIRDLSQSRNNRGTLQVTVSGGDIYCILQQTRDERAKPSIYPITTPCGVLYDATVEVYGERGLVGKKTTANGVATFENLQFGTYTVVASAPGYERAKEAVSIGIEKSPVVSITMTLQKIAPPSTNRPPQIIGLPPVPVNIEPGQQVLFSWSATDPDGDNLSWSGSVDKGGGIGEAWAGVCPSLSPNTTFTTSQSWPSAGVYRINVTVSDCKGGSDTNEFKVQVGGVSSNQPPVISGVKGPTVLKVGEMGTWSVSAYDPENGPLSYSVTWGDETPVVGGGGGSGAPLPLRSEISQTATFSHSYATGGMFTPTFIVTDNGNLGAKTSMSVNVGNITSAPSITVLAPNGGETVQIGKPFTVQWALSGFTSWNSNTNSVQLQIYDSTGQNYVGTFCIVCSSGVAGGSYIWTPSQVLNINSQWVSIQPGNYKIRATVSGKVYPDVSVNPMDFSDAPFSIVTQTVSYDACRLDMLNGVNITRDAIEDQAQCLAKICDVYGPSNLANGIESKCLFQWKEIKGYTKSPSITVLSPNGGEVWQKGTTQIITWKYNNPILPVCLEGTPCPLMPISFPSLVDIFIASWSPPCDSKIQPCPLAPTFGTFIAKGTPNDGAFEWKLGGNLAGTLVPDGRYIIIVSTSDGTAKDQSDAPFSIMSGTTDYKLSATYVSGNKSAYSAGEKIFLVIKGVELFDGSPGEPSEGLNVQYSLRGVNDGYNLQGGNATYNSQTGYWEAKLVAPTDVSKTYVVDSAFYCSNSSLACGKRYAGQYVQVNITFNFQVGGSGGRQPLMITLPNGGETYQTGQSTQIIWTADCGPNVFFVGLIKGNNLSQAIKESLPANVCSPGQAAVPYSINWSVPLSLTTGTDYRIWIYGSGGSNAYFSSGFSGDDSDAPFSIVSSPAGVGAVDSRELASVLEAMRAALDQISATLKTLR